MTVDDVARQFADIPENRPDRFDEMVGAVFAFQRSECAVYSRYCATAMAATHQAARSSSGAEAGDRRQATDAAALAPFLPVEAFKHAPVTTFPPSEAEIVFESSGTGRGTPSRHFVRNRTIYERAVRTHFREVFGDGPFIIVAHLPEYADRSSLVYMLHHLITTFGAEGSGFFLNDTSLLQDACARSKHGGVRLLLFGAAFGLIDFLDQQRQKLPSDSLVVETGGMKTYRRTMSREVLHARLAEGFGIDRAQIRSEYGMCEMMSQCYTRGETTFFPPPWMHFTVLNPLVPTREVSYGKSGALAVIDLANVYSCSFLLTGDRAVERNGGFDILGRLSGAELRGCNFLLEDA